jgi:hypothetical protein
MKKNTIVLIITIVLAIVAVTLIITSSKSTIRRELKDFAIDDTSNVSKIFLSDKNNRNILLVRQSDGSWQLNGKYKAQQESVDLLLKTMLNLAIMDPVPQSALNTTIRLLATGSTKVEIYQQVYRIDLFSRIRLFRHEKKSKTYYVGHVAQNNIGTYMLMENSEVPFLVYLPGLRGFVQSRYNTREKDWRDHQIFASKLQDIQSVEVDFIENPNQSYKVVNHDDRFFSLISQSDKKDISDFDTNKVVNFLASFANIRYEALIEDMFPGRRDSIIANLPFHVITLTEKSGKKVVVNTFHKPGAPGEIDYKGNLLPYDIDRFYALINDGKDFVLIQFYVFDKITRPVIYFKRSS